MSNFHDAFFEIMRAEGLCRRAANMRFHMWQLFGTYSFAGRSVLDIGGGRGELSFFAASRGASIVTCLEPSLAGSSSSCQETFQRIAAKYELSNVELCPITFQAYSATRVEQVDLIVSNASINHIDEDACSRLTLDGAAMQRFRVLAQSMFAALRPGGRLVIADCFRRNLFAQLGLRNWFAPNIEWELHQQPATWVSLFEETGFQFSGLRYQSFNSLGRIGPVLMNNWLAAYCITGDFILTFEKPLHANSQY